ncbi:hypothetical protein L1987_17704 [Smallanthus sonchifolius]|uniref:Uncharacterized protein n=1 Tax=Smallanthus sonchifolius TaxID=185202 RepID=A0ACB9IYQ1_9ASTR|nr:hypothetical protein L1987_17704 [Smallanthus sonchifolius]
MDPSIVKLLEEDEVIFSDCDETMHSGADVEAFTAALNRDIEGDNASTSQPPTSNRQRFISRNESYSKPAVSTVAIF